MVGSQGHAGKDIFRDLIDKMTRGSLDPSSLVTSRFGLSQAHEAFAHARAASGAKTIIRVEA